MSAPTMTTERRLAIPMSEFIEYARKTYAGKMPDDVKVCIDGVKCGADATVELSWAVTEVMAAKGG